MGAKAPILKLFRFDSPRDSEITQCCQSLATIPMTEICRKSIPRWGLKPPVLGAKAHILFRVAPINKKKSMEPFPKCMHCYSILNPFGPPFALIFAAFWLPSGSIWPPWRGPGGWAPECQRKAGILGSFLRPFWLHVSMIVRFICWYVFWITFGLI